ncbi:Vacuolar protein sorting-associated protein 29 [Histomonas meleagridis]|uniref:Vacuolar protein sorting-associated protein 29 n=1 Tax=Histomonas meleagridis TaxID=135588 RepID=UPI00355A00F6|nr:Vacuolar protein sorting-associated protein 29 [Histomonas meleagridis]KAH0803677.1 Vacuolar protein sorting-associated protein 29 [Histomonas meleagridis]
MIILVIGDLHIPERKLVIPDEFRKLLKPGKVHRILCTGNLTSKDELNWLKSICKDVIYVTGDYDKQLPDAKESVTVKLGSFTIGMIHGHQITPWGDPERLGEYARNMGVDIFISGQTHIPSISTYEGRLFLNPGSVTGAYSNTASESVPSFMVLDIKKDQLDVYQYSLNESREVEVYTYKHTMI